MLLRSGSDGVHLTVEDDGGGFAVDRTSGLGLRGMRERADGLGAVLEISSDAHGTRVTARIPAPWPLPSRRRTQLAVLAKDRG